MAESLQPGISLLSKIEAGTASINSVSAIKGEDSVISASDDKTVRVWVRRENNQYWPTVVQSFIASCSAMVCEQERDSDGHIVFIGLGNGQVMEFRLSKDLNKFERKRTIMSHTNRVTGLKYVSDHEWILSTSRDKRLQWCCTSTGRSLGTYESSAWCMAVEYDEQLRYAFVAEFNGEIAFIKLEENNIHKITAVKGHTGSVWALTFDPERRKLFSGSFDNTIVVWDIGSQQGIAYELNGHTDKINSLCYSTKNKKLMSCGKDKRLWVWDLDKDREEVPIWEKSDRCEICQSAFFWNVLGMWTDKTLPQKIVVRQHHCRKCGRAICASCSVQSAVFPKMGFEIPVRMCQDCHSSITPLDREPLAYSIDLKLNVISMSIEQKLDLLITGNEDKTITIYDISKLN